MYTKMIKYFAFLSTLSFLIACGGDSSDASNSYSDTASSDTSTNIISELKTFKSAYFTGFAPQNGNNLFEHTDQSLHITYVDNYELFYAKSTDKGLHWTKEKITTGHDGDIRRASLVVDKNGKVFIGFNVNDNYNYGNPTAVTDTKEFLFDLYCTQNLNGVWSVEKVDSYNKSTHSMANDGAEVADMLIDADNNLHIFANYGGWWNYGGIAYEYTRSSTSNTWGASTTIATYIDTAVEKAFYSYFKALMHSNGDITILMSRYKTSAGVDDKLISIQKQNGIWLPPVEFASPNRANPTNAHFDMAIDGNDNLYVVYLQDNTLGIPEIILLSSTNTTPSVAYTAVQGEKINEIKLLSNAEGDLTLLLSYKDKKASILSKLAMGTWVIKAPLETSYTNGILYNAVIARTDNLQNYFTHLKIAYRTFVDGVGVDTEKTYPASTLYFHDYLSPTIIPVPTPMPQPSTECSVTGAWSLSASSMITTFTTLDMPIITPLPASVSTLKEQDDNRVESSNAITFDSLMTPPYTYTLENNKMTRSEESMDTQSDCRATIIETWTINDDCQSATIYATQKTVCSESGHGWEAVIDTTAKKQ